MTLTMSHGADFRLDFYAEGMNLSHLVRLMGDDVWSVKHRCGEGWRGEGVEGGKGGGQGQGQD